MLDRFNIPDLPPVASPAQTTEALTAAFDYAQAALNTLNVEAALERLLLHGIGRVNDAGARLQFGEDGILRLSNGYFLAGSGITDETDASYFAGALVVRVNNADGYIELVGANAPPDGVKSFGHMSALGVVTWSNAPISPRPGNAWLIGSVTTDGAGNVIEVDDTIADKIGSAGTSGGGNGGSAVEFVEDLKWSRADPRQFEVVFDDKLNALKSEFNSRLDEIAGPVDGVGNATDRFLQRDLARVEVALVKLNPENALRIDASIVVPGIAGNGEILGVDEFGTTITSRDVHEGNTIYDTVKREER